MSPIVFLVMCRYAVYTYLNVENRQHNKNNDNCNFTKLNFMFSFIQPTVMLLINHIENHPKSRVRIKM